MLSNQRNIFIFFAEHEFCGDCEVCWMLWGSFEISTNFMIFLILKIEGLKLIILSENDAQTGFFSQLCMIIIVRKLIKDKRKLAVVLKVCFA